MGRKRSSNSINEIMPRVQSFPHFLQDNVESTIKSNKTEIHTPTVKLLDISSLYQSDDENSFKSNNIFDINFKYLSDEEKKPSFTYVNEDLSET